MNQQSGVDQINAAELKAMLNEPNLKIIDIRDPESYQENHIPGAESLDKTQLHRYIESADKNATYVVYCYRGISCIPIANEMREHGFTVKHLIGGYEAWQQEAS